MKNFNPSKKSINIVIGVFIVVFALYVLIGTNLQTANPITINNSSNETSSYSGEDSSNAPTEQNNAVTTNDPNSAQAKQYTKDKRTGANVSNPDSSKNSSSPSKKSSSSGSSGGGGSSGNIKENPSDYIE